MLYHENFIVVSQREEATIEHPVDTPGERNAVPHRVRSIVIIPYRPNVSSFNFRTASAIDNA